MPNFPLYVLNRKLQYFFYLFATTTSAPNIIADTILFSSLSNYLRTFIFRCLARCLSSHSSVLNMHADVSRMLADCTYIWANGSGIHL